MIIPERIHVGFGQLREKGTDYNQFSFKSTRPESHDREQVLIRQGKLDPLQPPTLVEKWPGITQPPNIPSSENEERRIRREMNEVLWPHEDTWNLNEPRPYEYVGQLPFEVKERELITMGTLGKKFPYTGVGVFGSGVVLTYVGNKYDLPIPIAFGLILAISGGLATLKEMTE